LRSKIILDLASVLESAGHAEKPISLLDTAAAGNNSISRVQG